MGISHSQWPTFCILSRIVAYSSLMTWASTSHGFLGKKSQTSVFLMEDRRELVNEREFLQELQKARKQLLKQEQLQNHQRTAKHQAQPKLLKSLQKLLKFL